MKGQEANVILPVVVAALMVLIGTMVYAYVADTTPHDQKFVNESICTTNCAQNVLYPLANVPITDTASDLVCYVNVSSGATSVLAASTTNGYQNIGSKYINLTNSSAAPTGDYTYRNVSCSYTYDWASADQETFYGTATSNAFSGMIMASIIVVVLATVAILGLVMFLRNE